MVKVITKKDFEANIAEKLNINKTEANKNLSAVLECIHETLKSGHHIQFTGFGKFSTSETKARIFKSFGGKEVNVPARKKILFKAGKELKESVNNK